MLFSSVSVVVLLVTISSTSGEDLQSQLRGGCNSAAHYTLADQLAQCCNLDCKESVTISTVIPALKSDDLSNGELNLPQPPSQSTATLSCTSSAKEYGGSNDSLISSSHILSLNLALFQISCYSTIVIDTVDFVNVTYQQFLQDNASSSTIVHGPLLNIRFSSIGLLDISHLKQTAFFPNTSVSVWNSQVLFSATNAMQLKVLELVNVSSPRLPLTLAKYIENVTVVGSTFNETR
jgi:hypothetical protein